MTKENGKVEIWRQDWFIELADRLSEYKETAARIKVLNRELLRDVGPDAKMIASYEDLAGGKAYEDISPKEKELFDKETEKFMLDAALDALQDEEKSIIKLRYIEQVNDWHIYDIKIRMSKSLYYEKRNEAMKKMAKCLGYDISGQSVDNSRTICGTKA